MATAGLWFYTARLYRATRKAVTDSEAFAQKSLAIAEKQVTLTGAQADILEKQKEISRLQFFAEHRPRMLIRDVNVVLEDGVLLIRYLAVNAGGSPAKDVQIWAFAVFVNPDSPIADMWSSQPPGFAKAEFAEGEAAYIDYTPVQGVTDYILPTAYDAAFDTARGMGELHFYGAIVYRDGRGIERRGAFRRVYDRKRNCFRRSDDPDQEYAD